MIISEKKKQSLQKQEEIENDYAKDWAEEQNEQIRRCVEEGIPCSYGICDECPATINSRVGAYDD